MPMKPIFEKVPGGCVAWVDGLPGAHTQGEARENLGDAVKLVLETRRIIGAMDAVGLWPPAWNSAPPRDEPGHDGAPHRPMIRHPINPGLDPFQARHDH